MTDLTGVVVYNNTSARPNSDENTVGMLPVSIIWDLDDEPEGNVQHIAEHGVTVNEVEEVLTDPSSRVAVNRNESGNELTFGFTRAGRYLGVAWQHVDDDPLTIYPVTAFDAPEPGRQRG